MSFDESKVSRESDGKFGSKEGAAAEVALAPESAGAELLALRDSILEETAEGSEERATRLAEYQTEAEAQGFPAGSAEWKRCGDGRPSANLRGDENLSKVMDFDHVIAVGQGGQVYDGIRNKYAPDAFNVDPYSSDLEGWELLSGYTGQHGYDGPWMHDSETLSGRMVDDILDRPGYYVAVYASYPDEDEPETGQTYEEGWAVAYKPFESDN